MEDHYFDKTALETKCKKAEKGKDLGSQLYEEEKNFKIDDISDLNSQEKVKKRRVKRTFKDQMALELSYFQSSQRQDVVIKGILRQIRRYYVWKFNSHTNYIHRKRGKKSDFYPEQISIFVDSIKSQF